jgi:CBS domain-containing membrane protein
MTAKRATASQSDPRAARVRDLMTEKVVSVGPGTDLLTVRNLMDDRLIRHLPVVEDGMVVGLISQRDLLRVAADRSDLPLSLALDVLRMTRARDVMTRDVETVGADDALADAARLMLDNKYGCLPVADGGALCGILTEADFVRLVARPD